MKTNPNNMTINSDNLPIDELIEREKIARAALDAAVEAVDDAMLRASPVRRGYIYKITDRSGKFQGRTMLVTFTLVRRNFWSREHTVIAEGPLNIMRQTHGAPRDGFNRVHQRIKADKLIIESAVKMPDGLRPVSSIDGR
jgi:hypothetical protein